MNYGIATQQKLSPMSKHYDTCNRMNLISILLNGRSQTEMNKKECILYGYIYIKLRTRKSNLWC